MYSNDDGGTTTVGVFDPNLWLDFSYRACECVEMTPPLSPDLHDYKSCGFDDGEWQVGLLTYCCTDKNATLLFGSSPTKYQELVRDVGIVQDGDGSATWFLKRHPGCSFYYEFWADTWDQAMLIAESLRRQVALVGD